MDAAPKKVTGDGPLISVIVVAYNAERTIARCLESLCTLDFPSYEILVVDDGSTDGTCGICREYRSVNLIRAAHGGPSRARNLGVRAARGHLVAFTDSDCIPAPGWLTELLRGFIDDKVAAVGGDQQSPEGESAFGCSVQEYLKTIGFMIGYINMAKSMTPTCHNPSCNVVYRRDILEAIGGFPDDQFPCEDLAVDIQIRKQGYRLYYNPAAVVGHFRPANYRDFARMMRRYGSGAWCLRRKFGVFRRLDCVPWFLFLFALALLASVGCSIALLYWVVAITAFSWTCFLVKTFDLKKGSRFALLFFLTLLHWNYGYVTGFRYRPWK